MPLVNDSVDVGSLERVEIDDEDSRSVTGRSDSSCVLRDDRARFAAASISSTAPW